MKKHTLALCVGFLIFPHLAFANTELIDGNNAQEILNIAKGFGSAELTTDSVGDPLIKGRILGKKYGILFYGCTKGKNCKYVKFTASFEVNDGTLEKTQKWNDKYSLGRIRLDDEQDIVVDYPVMLYKGVSKAAFEVSFDYWETIIKSVIKDFGIND